MSGPIIKNKTFFFALFEGQRDMKRNRVSSLTWTDMAKAGIFRYFPGVDNQNSNQAEPDRRYQRQPGQARRGNRSIGWEFAPVCDWSVWQLQLSGRPGSELQDV